MGDLVPLLYDRLRILARARLRALRPGRTLDTTALVHELYVRFAEGQYDWKSRNHFLCASAVAMRHILVEEARRRAARKHGGEVQRVTLGEPTDPGAVRAVEILDLERALEALGERDPQLVQVVELRFYGGLTVPEAASVLDLSARTVNRAWQKARGILHSELAG